MRPERWQGRCVSKSVQHSEVIMADDVDAEAERAANAARASVKRAHRANSSSLLPLLVVVFAILTVAVLVMTDRNATQPTTPRAESPTITQPGTQPGN
jgi:hypothetical protein